MGRPDNQENSGASSENIFSIVDRLVYQINLAKRIILGMVIAIIIAIPVIWHVSPLLLGTPRLAGLVTIIIVAGVFFAIGVRQWTQLSEWTRRYKAYKENQRKIDETLDFDDGVEGSGNSGT